MSTSPTTSPHSSGHAVINPADVFWSPDRMRKLTTSVQAHIDDLVQSIAKYGIIQPFVIHFNPEHDNRPEGIAGWCRSRACAVLELDSVPYVLRKDVAVDVAKALELEENLRRHDMTWQEKMLGIYETHQLKVKTAALDFKSWGQRETGKVLGLKAASVNTAIKLAQAMLAGNEAVLNASSVDEAEKALLASQQDMLTSILASKAGVTVAVSTATKIKDKKSGVISDPLTAPTVDPLDNLVDPSIFGDLMPSRSNSEQHKPAGKQVHEVELSKMLFNVDCHEWFASQPKECVDLIYTDIPFGIDMANLDTIDGIEVVAHAHEIEENVSQMKPFLEGAFKVLKNDAYLMFFYDLKHHEKLFNWATEAGFKVQGWPVVWLKTHTCRNMAPQYNWTKATEYVMVCRKGSPTLKRPQMLNYIAANGKAEKQLQRNPFAKPFDFSRQILDAVVFPGMTVLDCYAGGGSLCRAAINMGCRIIALEKDPKQFHALEESIKATFKSMLRGEVNFV